MSVSEVSPVMVFQQQMADLDMAMTDLLAGAKSKRVHTLRTTVRRSEAQMELMLLLPGAPDVRSEVKEVRRRLRKLRRAAGAVRDRDVQVGQVQAKVGEGTGAAWRREVEQLTKRLEKDRRRAAKGLRASVKRQQKKLARPVARLIEAFAPVAKSKLSGKEMVSMVRKWVAMQLQAEVEPDEESHLHGVRKTAKLARYMAEGGPEGMKALRELGQRFESLQQSGGVWHDWLTLSLVAREFLGGSSLLRKRFEDECRASLRTYVEAISASELGSVLMARNVQE